MPAAILNDSTWFRTVEILYRGQEFTGVPLKSTYTVEANPIIPGQVVAIINNEVVLADDALSGGAFHGLMYSEFSARLDETDGGTIDPVIITGPATVAVFNDALDESVTLALDAANVVELVANGGKLKVRGAETTPSVGTLTKVLDDRVEIQLNAPQGAAR